MESVINRQSLKRRSSLYSRGRTSVNSWDRPGQLLTRVQDIGSGRTLLRGVARNRQPSSGFLNRLEQAHQGRHGATGTSVPAGSRLAAIGALFPAMRMPVQGILVTFFRWVADLTGEFVALPYRVLSSASDGDVAPLDQGFIAGGILFVLAGIAIVSNPSMQDILRYSPFPTAIALDYSRLADPFAADRALDDQFHLDGASVELDISRFQALSFEEHTVAPGETISGIAARYGITMDTLVSFNQINDSRRVQVGTVFQIPSRSGLRHIVRSGESLGSIASSYGVAVPALLDANDLTTDTVAVGQELFIPEARMRSTELRLILGELFIMPTTGRLTSGFGYRPDPFTGRRSFHNGIDWAAPRGTPIVASMAGRVVESGVHSIYGNYVVIQHPEGFQSLYAHMDRILVSRGQNVSQRQQIGTMGSTGRSTGSHLHFSLFRNGQAVDPMRHIHR